MARSTPHPFIVLNREGAAGVIGTVADMNVQTINGSVDFTVTLPNILTLGRGVRALATASETPLEALPSVPPLKTLGWTRSGFSSIHLLFAPRGLPADALAWLRKACAEAVSSGVFQAAAARMYTVPRHADGEAFDTWMRETTLAHGERIQRIKMQGE